jgi:hypothetical protein
MADAHWTVPPPEEPSFEYVAPTYKGNGDSETNSEPQYADEQPRYVIHMAAEALEPLPPIDWIIEGIFTAGSIALFAGEAKSGKTYAILDAAVAVAQGEDWLEHTVKQASCLIIDEESGPRRMLRRLGDVMRGHDADGGLELFFISLARFDLWDMNDVAALQSAIMDTGARFVIIDALADVMPGRDENAVKEVQPIFMALRSIAEETQSCIVVIHHFNKMGSARGSSAIDAAVDLLLSVSKEDDILTFASVRARDVEPFTFAARGNWLPGSFNLSPAEMKENRPHYAKSQRYVIRYMGDNGPSTMSDIKNHADICSAAAARQAVYTIIDRGLAHRADQGGPGETATYALTTDGYDIYNQL